MKVCLYLEHHGSGSWSSGILQAYRNHVRALQAAGVAVTSDPDEDADVLHLESIGPRSLYLAEKYRGQRPLIIHGHTTAEDFANSFVMSDVLAQPFGRLLARYYNKADRVVVPTAYTRDVLRRWDVVAPIDIVSNGVDVGRFAALRRRRSLARGRLQLQGIVVFAVGLVLLRKGIDVFCDVARRLPDLTFVWFGRIPRGVKPETHRVLEEAPPNVRFPGYLEDVADAYAAGDIFFFPSTVENEGLVVLEAAAAGRPLVLRRAECFQDRFSDGETCLMASDADGLAGHIRRLAEDDALRSRLADAARRFAAEHALERVGARLRATYERAVRVPAQGD